MKFRTSLFLILGALLFIGCNSSVEDDINDAIDLADGVPRKTIDRTILGVNGFFNLPQYGSIPEQYSEIRSTLGIRFIRVLFAWNDQVQPTPDSEPKFGLYDEIIENAPAGVELLVILTDVPSWVAGLGGNPREAFVNRWVRTVVSRYGAHRAIGGWQIWNEPNMPGRADNAALQLTTSPENFVELVALASSVIQDGSPGRRVVSGATTAINQNYPETRDYNRAMRDAGILNFIDAYGAHYYGRQFENLVRSNGIADFLNGLGKPIWFTESGEQGSTEQLKYGEQVWPFLTENVGSIERIYQYQMYEPTPADSTYGLRFGSGDAVSDLYAYLRSQQQG